MNVLSLFDGMSCGQIALNRAGIEYNNYYASEINKYCIKVTQANYPNTIQLGDIKDWKVWNLPKIDLIIGGSPCQGFSFAGKQLNFEDHRSRLFFYFVDILNKIKPKYFLLENVKMKKKWENIITKYLKIKPVLINSSLVSAQNRKRLYWTNIGQIQQPKNKKIFLKDILEYRIVDQGESEPCIGAIRGRYYINGKRQDAKMKTAGLTSQYIELRQDKKSNALSTVQKDNIVIIPKYNSKKQLKYVAVVNKNKKWLGNGKILQRNFSKGERIYSIECKYPTLASSIGETAETENQLINNNETPFIYRKLTPIEYERLQTVSDNYTKHVSNTQRYKMLSNGWTVDVIVHILKNIKNNKIIKRQDITDFIYKK